MISTITTAIVALLAALGGAGTLLFFKQNKSSATADAISKSAEAMEKMNTFIDKQQSTFNNIIDQKDAVVEQKRIMIEINREELRDQQKKIDEYDFRIATLERQNKGLSDQVGILMARLEKAENAKCESLDCDTRK